MDTNKFENIKAPTNEKNKGEIMALLEDYSGSMASAVNSGKAEEIYQLLRELFQEQQEPISVFPVVSGGLVRYVYANGPITVNVLDLDYPEFSTEEEIQEIAEMERKADELAKNPDFYDAW